MQNRKESEQKESELKESEWKESERKESERKESEQIVGSKHRRRWVKRLVGLDHNIDGAGVKTSRDGEKHAWVQNEHIYHSVLTLSGFATLAVRTHSVLTLSGFTAEAVKTHSVLTLSGFETKAVQINSVLTLSVLTLSILTIGAPPNWGRFSCCLSFLPSTLAARLPHPSHITHRRQGFPWRKEGRNY